MQKGDLIEVTDHEENNITDEIIFRINRKFNTSFNESNVKDTSKELVKEDIKKRKRQQKILNKFHIIKKGQSGSYWSKRLGKDMSLTNMKECLDRDEKLRIVDHTGFEITYKVRTRINELFNTDFR